MKTVKNSKTKLIKNLTSKLAALTILATTLGSTNVYAANNYNTKIKVTDKNGVVDTYDSKEISQPTGTSYNKIFDKNNIKNIVDDTFANISVTGDSVNKLKYQVIKSDSTPTSIPDGNWQQLDLADQNQVLKNDVQADKKGFLSWRSYSVDHLPVMDSMDIWNKADMVFKHPNNQIGIKDAKRSTTADEYIKRTPVTPYNVKLEDGSNKQVLVNGKWDTNSVFVDTLGVNGDYKEASKFWGYIKVDKDGDYNFGALSDDGIKGFITVNKTSIQFCDSFRVQHATFSTANTPVHLSANVYYPIYLEYFNWGGWASFSLKYSYNGSSEWKYVDRTWFYPSNTTTPGEVPTAIFTGANADIKIPSESGNYYITYKIGANEMTGIYGPFVRKPSSDLVQTPVSTKTSTSSKTTVTVKTTTKITTTSRVTIKKSTMINSQTPPKPATTNSTSTKSSTTKSVTKAYNNITSSAKNSFSELRSYITKNYSSILKSFGF